MSVSKLLSRIVAPSEDINLTKSAVSEVASSLHDHTYGITSDPLTQFACLLSALIHDADHPGVPNAQLVKEKDPMAVSFENKSVAEQNSVQLAWSMLMEDQFKELRMAICATEEECVRFRQLIVNVVMATDIVDKDLKKLRNSRWEKAFSDTYDESPEMATNRKATIVIEHLIQASDVAHTMQHWHIYRKWNERFFLESYKAFRDGRAPSNPAINWYQGEIGFFDFYIIPLAKKLKDCGVFGVSSDGKHLSSATLRLTHTTIPEYLTYALKNREEWESRGEEIVAAMIEKHTPKGPKNHSSERGPAATKLKPNKLDKFSSSMSALKVQKFERPTGTLRTQKSVMMRRSSQR